MNRFLFYLITALMMGCTTENLDLPSEKVNIEVAFSSATSEPMAYFSTGQVTKTYTEYSETIKQLSNDGYEIDKLDFTMNTSQQQGNKIRSPLSNISIPYTDYMVIYGMDWGYVPCVKKYASHYNFQVRNKISNKFVDLHVAFWSQNGKPCFGIYVTKDGNNSVLYCWPGMCGPSLSDLQSIFASALVAAGIATGTAKVIATYSAPLVFFAI